ERIVRPRRVTHRSRDYWVAWRVEGERARGVPRRLHLGDDPGADQSSEQPGGCPDQFLHVVGSYCCGASASCGAGVDFLSSAWISASSCERSAHGSKGHCRALCLRGYRGKGAGELRGSLEKHGG